MANEREFIGLDLCEANEGFNSKLDYYGKINCRVFVDDTTLRLSDSAVYYALVSEVISAAQGYAYADNYEYSGEMVIDGSNISYTIPQSVVAQNQAAVMNDFARFVGAMYRNDNGASVQSIVYDGVEYTWDTGGTLLGSNWKNAEGATLVSKVVAALKPAFEAGEPGSAKLLINGKDEMVLSFEIVAE